MTKKHILLLASLTFIGTVPLFASGPSFRPDTKMDGTSLKGWHPYGQADWRTEKGEIVGVPKAGGCRLARYSTIPIRTVPFTLNTAVPEVASPVSFSVQKKHQRRPEGNLCRAQRPGARRV